ncbi:uncharacterized protein LOC130164362 isoform X2 [Seriola aureovittata]|uniref:uncharacterized protein LOC130164362 isoform X2 n=1 Tax=Seriola aureovittata TaxID=2871759 RepID=UPI0024BD96E5|nr:uncharacterized protein LOC130164362 isoform X2 [Seriola aureovittata]
MQGERARAAQTLSQLQEVVVEPSTPRGAEELQLHTSQLHPLQAFIMKSSSSSSSSSVTSSSVTARLETQLLCSSSSAPPPPPSLQSPELQAEFVQECRSKFPSHGDVSESSVVSSPSSCPRSSSSSSSPPCSDSRPARLSLSSPELLSELKESRTRPLRHVPAHYGLTTVFSGRGGQASGPALSTRPANQRTSH